MMSATPLGSTRRRLTELLRHTGRTYAQGEDQPLGGYLKTIAGFGAYTTAWAVAIRLRGRPLPGRPEPWDVLLTAAATFRLSRLLSKGVVTSPLRAPFTRFNGPQGPSELAEEPRPDAGHAVGELMTCPFCMSVWVAATFTGCQVMWPRATQLSLGALSALAGADAMQLAYGALMEKSVGQGERPQE